MACPPGSDLPLLRVPPFPGSAPVAVQVKGADESGAEDNAAAIAAALRAARVGGTFWAARPRIAEGDALLAWVDDRASLDAACERARAAGKPLLCWLPDERLRAEALGRGHAVVVGEADPWHLLDHASEVIAPAGSDLFLLAAVAGDARDAPQLVQERLLTGWRFVDPFSGRPASARAVIDLLGFWRGMIDANRPIRAVHGIAAWKQASVAPLLWGGSGTVPFGRKPATGEPAAFWRTRTAPALLAQLDQPGRQRFEVEDGFIRSVGLGADCVPPLSIVVDETCAHYDQSGPSGLERLLAEEDFAPDLLNRARHLRGLIVARGISKYSVGGAVYPRTGGNRRHVLVTGQVEDDQSVRLGGGGIASNLDLLRRVRLHAPEAFIIYRPHPDVDAGHRKGHVDDAQVLHYADTIARDVPITALIDAADEVHVLTSLAGFEALLRGKAVTTHGVPFYAGWSLTTDLGPVPARRGRARTLDELVAATLLLYPRYLDPLTGLPCPPEVLLERLASGVRRQNGPLVAFRRLLGRAIKLARGAGLAR